MSARVFLALYVLFLFAMVFTGPFLSTPIRELGWLSNLTAAMLAGSVAIAGLILRRRAGLTGSAMFRVLAFLVLSFTILFPFATTPEERLHFVEYGFFPLVLLRARVCGTSTAWATTLSAAFGCLDEGIQALLPYRYFEWKDVAINVASSVIGGSAIALSRLKGQSGDPRPR